VSLSLNLEHFKMSGLLTAIKARASSDSAMFKLRMNRLIVRFEAALTSQDMPAIRAMI
jgi:hypothetical protein